MLACQKFVLISTGITFVVDTGTPGREMSSVASWDSNMEVCQHWHYQAFNNLYGSLYRF